uniref:Uncharacterized protein n=1 Tax=Laticauda laticaudata TaxID=8630 RepID=A0A8C5RVT5_LATLA
GGWGGGGGTGGGGGVTRISEISHPPKIRPGAFFGGNVYHFENLETNSRSVTNSRSFSTKAVQRTIIGNKSCYFLPILDELDSDAVSDSRIWLLSLLTHFFQNNSLGTRSFPRRIGFQSRTQMGLLVLLVMPLLFTTVTMQLPGCTKGTTVAHRALRSVCPTCERHPHNRK